MLAKIRGALRSVTVWFNVMLLTLLPFHQDILDAIPQIQPYLPDNLYKTVGLAAVMINLALRFKTTADLAAK